MFNTTWHNTYIDGHGTDVDALVAEVYRAKDRLYPVQYGECLANHVMDLEQYVVLHKVDLLWTAYAQHLTDRVGAEFV